MSRSKSWGFPRWGGYGRETDPVTVRLCDWPGCEAKGEHPAPKSRCGTDRWMFCQEHAGQYNKSWNYFSGMSDEEARRAAQEEAREARGYTQSGAWTYFDGSTREERERDAAYALLGLDETASQDEIKARFRRMAKDSHPDQNPGDKEAEERFIRITAAYELLRARG